MKSNILTAPFDTDADLTLVRSRSHPWWLYANLLSLDAPIVAVVWLGAFSRAFDSSVAFSVYAVLFLAVWSIYVADRLLDSLRQQNWSLATQRHRFVRRYQKRFIGLLIVILTLTAVTTVNALPIDLIIAGLVLGSVVGIYFTAFVRLFPRLKPLRAKEFACGVVFAAGTALGVDTFRHGAFIDPGKYLPAVFLFAALCIYNCLIIAARERHTDQVNDPAAASVWWKYLDRDLAVSGVILITVTATAWILRGQPLFYSACFISALALSSIHLLQKHFSNSISRVLADAALLSPMLLI